MFKKLRGKLKELDIDQEYLANKLDICVMSVSRKFTGKRPWTLDEMYAVMDLIQEPYELLNEYFPKDGRDDLVISKSRAKILKNKPEGKYRAELISIALRILYELDGKVE